MFFFLEEGEGERVRGPSDQNCFCLDSLEFGTGTFFFVSFPLFFFLDNL